MTIALPPDPPLARATAIRIAEEAWHAWHGPHVLHSDLAAIVDRILGPASEVERAERAAIDALLARGAFAADDDAGARLAAAAMVLRAARERAGR